MDSAIFNIIMAILAIVLVFFIVMKRKLSLKEDIGVVIPRLNHVLIWLLGFIILIGIEEFFYNLEDGGAGAEIWTEKYTTFEIILRFIGVVLLAPVSEELLFRGLIFSQIKKTRFKVIGAIVIPALIFSLIHIQYSSILILGLIFVDGLFYGMARHYTKSVLVPIILHLYSNLGAVLERLL